VTTAPSDDVPRFDRSFTETGEPLTRIGAGRLGGKASGLRLIASEIIPRLDHARYPETTVTVPTLTVLTTDLFRSFVDRNRLRQPAPGASDERIAHAFQQAELPAEIVGDLRGLISSVHTPLAVRSSSLLEDDLHHPFAGVYATKMIPNNEIEEDARFRRLVEAVKFVYASTYFGDARDYHHALGHDLLAEEMAVVVQEVIGERIGDRFYPTVSGVARSFNFYPTAGARPDEGVVYLALGLGKTIVDGGLCWGFSPSAPAAPPPFNDVNDLLKNTQRDFWAVHMGDPPLPDPVRETEYLVRPGLKEAEEDDSLKHIVSTYDAGSDRLYPGVGGRGPRALNFAPLLGSRWLPFVDLVSELLDHSKTVVGSDVEIEFAIRLDRRDLLPARFGFLQVRPMRVGTEDIRVDDAELARDDVVVSSTRVLGNGELDGIRDIVYLRPEAFDPQSTVAMARELGSINRELVDAGRRYVLIGFGRWGTSDERLGVPVAWGQISGARVIVEVTTPEVDPDLSQGSHFFHNVLSFQVLCLAVEHHGQGSVDWTWLAAQPALSETARIRHIRVSEPLGIRVDGARGRGVITHHD
jgi:hypothetical protein